MRRIALLSIICCALAISLAAAGVTLGLGSDSYIDNFFEVMRAAFLIHKANGLDPRLMPAPLVFYLATEGGARALGLERSHLYKKCQQLGIALHSLRRPE